MMDHKADYRKHHTIALDVGHRLILIYKSFSVTAFSTNFEHYLLTSPILENHNK